MALTSIVWGDGFTGYVTALLSTRYNDLFETPGTNLSIAAGAGRLGNPALKMYETRFVAKTVPSATQYNVAFAMKLDALPVTTRAIVEFKSGGTVQGGLAMTASGQVHFYRSSVGTPIGSTSSWAATPGIHFHLEAQYAVHDSTGIAICRLGGNSASPILNGSGLDTRNGTPTDITQVKLMSPASATSYFSDFVIGNDWIGDYHFTRATPTGAGNYAEYTPSAGANWECVDDASPDGDTTKVSSSTLNHRDSHVMSNAASGATILAVIGNVYAKKSDTGARELNILSRISSTDYVGVANILATDYQWFQEPLLVSPASAVAWTESEYNGAERGYKTTV